MNRTESAVNGTACSEQDRECSEQELVHCNNSLLSLQVVYNAHVRQCTKKPTKPTHIYKCSRCHFSTKNAKLFLKHGKVEHNEFVDLYPCDCCEYVSRYMRTVLKHRCRVQRINLCCIRYRALVSNSNNYYMTFVQLP